MSLDTDPARCKQHQPQEPWGPERSALHAQRPDQGVMCEGCSATQNIRVVAVIENRTCRVVFFCINIVLETPCLARLSRPIR